tara:strand:+ start:1123 stop:1860 length:738 start_codon:yes stop_codon:yes gene_type:complete
MKKLFFIILNILLVFTLKSQVIQERLLQVNPANVAKFEAAVAKKTQIYNSKEDQPNWVTFQILTGPQAYNYIRMQIVDSIPKFDNIDQIGNDYWQKTVGPLHTSVGNRMWWVNNEMTYTPEVRNKFNHRRIIYYNVKDDGLDDFWRYRERAKRIWTEMNYENRVGVMNCMSGCDGNWVQVRFHHEDFASEARAWENLPKFAKKYNDIFGEGSLEEDQERLRASLMPDGRRIRHHKRMPSLSTPWR